MKPLLNLFVLLIFSSCLYAQDFRSFKDGQTYGFKNNGKIIIPPQYEYAFDFNEGLALVQKGGLWGFINTQNTEIVQCLFDRCSEFNEGFATVILNGKTGIIDSTGQYAVPPECSEVRVLSDGVCLGKKDGKSALFKEGERLTEFTYDEITTIYCSAFTFKKGELYGVLTLDGEELIPAESSQEIYCNSYKNHGMYFVGKSKKLNQYSYYSSNGKLVIDGDEYETNRVKYPLIYSMTKNGKSRIVNVSTGEEILPFTEVSSYKSNWRPCDGYGYRSPSQIFFQKDEGLLMVSAESPFNSIQVSERPIILEEFILVQNGPSKADVYSHKLELLAKDINMNIKKLDAVNPKERICTYIERGIVLWKAGQFGVWDEASGSINFVDHLTMSEQSLFRMDRLNSETPAQFNRIAQEGDNFIFELINGSEKTLYIAKEGSAFTELDVYPADAKIKFKKFIFEEYQEGDESLKVLNNIIVKVDGKKMDYPW